MNLRAAVESLGSRQRARRTVAWAGGLFIGVIIAMAGYDIYRGYVAVVEITGRELDTQARVIAEQTARTFQAVDVQLRHLERQFREGTLSKMSSRDLRAYLEDQAVGLVQIDGLLVATPEGKVLASSYMSPEQEARIDVSRRPLLHVLRAGPTPSLVIAAPEKSQFDGRWMFPMGRSLVTPSGQFAGSAVARGRIDYFQQFYRDVRLDQGTVIALLQLNGTLLARYPEAESALGRRFPLFDALLAAYNEGQPAPSRTVSPIDGVERFGALRLVPDYPLAVVVTRDVAVALAPWRALSRGAVIRLLALSVLAALLLAVALRQLSRLQTAESERVRLESQLLQAKKLEAIGTLAGGIAHDFNNILSAILGYGEMAQKDSKEGTPLRRHIDAALSAGMRAKSLVERILAFSRSGIGERVPIHVQSVVEEALSIVAASLPKEVRLERRFSAGDAAVLGDPTQIHQVVMNLCTNAIQAMKSGGTLTVSLDVAEKGATRVATSGLAGGRYLRLAVRDTGAGMPAKVLERIFDPFFTTKEVGVGTGLGLSLVHGIVTDLGGGIDVESRVGEGTTFTVYLPWSSSAALPASAEEAVPAGAGETILLVDDEEPLVRLGEEMIAGLGYEPVGFTSSAAALQSFRASPGRFHAVLSDEAMPEMTGSDLAKEIHAIRPDIPIVLMSGFVSPALLGRARDLGVMEVLAKPLVERDIARGLANALRNGARP
jgi:signal transduction histidine kinase/CheY-like chemotaxis protein